MIHSLAMTWFAEKSPRLPASIKPRRDMVVTDGQKLTLGDRTVEIHLTPGHTPGTVSLIYLALAPQIVGIFSREEIENA